MAAGTPDGVRVLSPHESINLYNGTLSFIVPIYNVGGRGGAGYSMSLPIGVKWNIENHPNNGADVFLPVANVYPYEELWPAASGVNRYSPGKFLLRVAIDPGQSTYKCLIVGTPGAGDTYFQAQTLTKMVWLEADGTEHEFLDQTNSGSPMPASTPTYHCQDDPTTGGPDRGRVFLADDASGATFVADNDIHDPITSTAKNRIDQKGVAGWLLLKDGTRYYGDSTGNVTQIVDRLGNTTSIANSSSSLTVTDSLGRQTNVTYGQLGGATSPVSDTITYIGASGQSHKITVTYDALGNNHLIAGSTLQTLKALFDVTNGSAASGKANPFVVSSIVLPDGSSYNFLYNSYAELAQATLPSGAVYQYDYPATTPDDCTTGSCLIGYSQNDAVTGGTQEYAVIRRVTARRVYPNGVSAGLEGQQCYSASYSNSGGGATVNVKHYGSDAQPGCATGTLLSVEKHNFVGNPAADLDPPPTWNQYGLEGKETNTQLFESDGATVDKSVSKLWTLDTVFQQNAVECESNATLGGPASVTSGSVTLYDGYFNVTDAYEYDFGSAPAIGTSCPSSAPTNWKRRKHTSYLTSGYDTLASPLSAPNSDHLRSLATESDVYQPDGTTVGTLVAKTQYGYDTGSVTPESSPTGFTAPTHPHLGNLTSKTAFPNLTAAGLTTNYAYDNLGNVLTLTDPRSKSTQILYTDSCSSGPGGALFAFPTKVTDAAGQVSNIKWDCYIGKQTSFQDPNLVTTDYLYKYNSNVDSFDRLQQVQRAAGKPEETHLTFGYPDLKTVTTSGDRTTLDDASIKTTVLYDGLSRPTETRTFLGSCYITVKKSFDGKGRPYTSSLPYNSCGETQHVSTTKYDGADRAIVVATDDGSKTATGYNGNQTTVTDPSGAARTVTTDALGRVTGVAEDPSSKNYLTSYTYDLLDNLLTVSQSGQSYCTWPPASANPGTALYSRCFSYDATGRLIAAANPESGSICYGTLSGIVCTANYDGNGNLLSKVDAKNTTTTFTYDALNRLHTKSYSDNATSPVTYTYGDAGIGACATGTSYNANRMSQVASAATGSLPVIAELASYDALGRVCGGSQQIGSTGTPYSFSYQYDKAGELITETYPSGRSISTAYDQLSRAIGVSSGSTTYVNSANTSYASHGAPAQIQFGPAGSAIATQTFTYDQGQTTLRQQPTAIQVNNGAGAAQLKLNYYYCSGTAASCSNNNGNLKSSTIIDSEINVSQQFGYDKLNRLTSAAETGGTTEWSHTYAYDAFGNRAVSGIYIPNPYATPTALAQYDARNRWLGTGANYDLNGNQTALPSRNYGYDAENRLISSTQPSTPTIAYMYDGEGRRIQKTVGSNTTTYVYDKDGQLTAEYSTAASTASGTQYLISDALGSTRMIIGSQNERIDYLPFGEELPSPEGGRGAGFGAGVYPGATDLISQKFTGKERDAETGLDYFGARYMSSPQGRFTSPDPKSDPHDIEDPQTWNKYTYTRNNPLRFTDPDGQDFKDRLLGALNAFGSDNALGAGRATSGNSDFKAGQADGDLAATFVGAAESFLGGAEALVTAPAALTGLGAVVPAAGVVLATHGAATAITATGNLANAALSSSTTLQPGPHAGDSVPARGPQRDFTPQEREKVNAAGQSTGCHTCGTKNPGTKGGNFVPDHQPPNAVNPPGGKQELYPHCLGCSRKQGGEVRQVKPNKTPNSGGGGN